jgi:hypothetical protein
MNEGVRQTQEITRLPETFTAEEAAEYCNALEAAGISCQVANEVTPHATDAGRILWVRGDDFTRAQAVVAAHRARINKSTGQP